MRPLHSTSLKKLVTSNADKYLKFTVGFNGKFTAVWYKLFSQISYPGRPYPKRDEKSLVCTTCGRQYSSGHRTMSHYHDLNADRITTYKHFDLIKQHRTLTCVNPDRPTRVQSPWMYRFLGKWYHAFSNTRKCKPQVELQHLNICLQSAVSFLKIWRPAIEKATYWYTKFALGSFARKFVIRPNVYLMLDKDISHLPFLELFSKTREGGLKGILFVSVGPNPKYRIYTVNEHGKAEYEKLEESELEDLVQASDLLFVGNIELLRRFEHNMFHSHHVRKIKENA